jgi:hypothetical protein
MDLVSKSVVELRHCETSWLLRVRLKPLAGLQVLFTKRLKNNLLPDFA